MTPSQKRQLMNELTEPLGWAVRVLHLVGAEVSVGFVNFFEFESEWKSSPAKFRPQDNPQLAELVELFGLSKFNGASLEYRFTGHLALYPTNLGLEREVEEQMIDALLDVIPVGAIRELFAQHDRDFFEETGTTPADWRMNM